MQDNYNCKRLLIIVSGIPHKSSGASTVLYYHYIEALKKLKFNIRNILLIQPENANEEHLNCYINEISSPGEFEVVPVVSGKNPIRSYLFGFKLEQKFQAEVCEKINAFHPDTIICFDILSAWIVSGISSTKKIVWLGDLAFHTAWYHALYTIKERKYLYPLALPIMAMMFLRCRSWRKIYFDALSQRTSIVVSSKSSETHLRKIGLDSTYLPYPWPNFSVSEKSRVLSLSESPSFIFYGTLRALGSRSAFHFIIYKLYPKLIDLWGDRGFKIIIAGRGKIYPWVEKALVNKPELEYLGFVEDLEGLMKSCHAVLAPIEVPVGNRSRILTSMANKCLVIAHRNTAIANPELIDNETCFLAEDVNEFIEKMKRSINDSENVSRIVNNAYQVYKNYFYPESASGLFLDYISKII